MKRIIYAFATVAVVGAGMQYLSSASYAQGDSAPNSYVRLQNTTPGLAQNGHMRITGKGLFGGIAIGTDSPVRPLHITHSDQYGARFEGAAADRAAIELRSTTSNTTWEFGVTGSSPSYNLAAGAAYLYHPGENHVGMFIRTDGFVGFPGTVSIGSLSFGESAITAHDITGIGAAGHFHSTSGGGAVGAVCITDGDSGAVGVVGFSGSTTGANYGVWGRSASPDGYGVFANGVLGASGTKQFRIDHPLDPENKYLIHYSAEGPEPLLIYSGTARLDSSGKSLVRLPDYYDEIAKDARIQLTPAGAPMPNLFASETVSENKFLIAGGKAGGKVYWEVKAVRNDAWVRTYGAPVEIEKTGADKGTYQHPELYGKKGDDPMTKRMRCDIHR